MKEILVQHCIDHGPSDEASLFTLRETAKLSSSAVANAVPNENLPNGKDAKDGKLHATAAVQRATRKLYASKEEQRMEEQSFKQIGCPGNTCGASFYLSGITNIHPLTTTVDRIECLTELFPSTKSSSSLARDSLPLQISSPQIISLAKSLALPIFCSKR